ncbi:pyridine nucleotide-disulfide oxidoreductase [Gammaproteobacteria bacterium LSUCC0057]|uniref:Pyridine nucleotide-disulfide oxidoreductase n=1 Tax=Gammaproteobacteria bacterium LSUCC0057 TaxID=2559237 RepID=A0A4Y8UFK1_9GAMM|nr:pyridine nucleotide-disulfide oxidoreductase [Gammaproteobacteria bacterium LSUCC0057]
MTAQKNWITLVDGSRYRTSSIPTLLSALLISLILAFGWSIRDEYFINAEHGLGYALGIVGGLMMLVLLIYPLRKRLPRSNWFVLTVPGWFRLHMLLGLLGPLAILYHSNFSFGSTNSNIALVCMLLMATSGIVGRYIYSRIHAGLYGRKLQMAEMIADKQQLTDTLTNQQTVVVSEAVLKQLLDFEASVLPQANKANQSLAKRAITAFKIALQTRQLARQLRLQLRAEQLNLEFSSPRGSEQRLLLLKVQRQVVDYLSLVRRIAELDFFERLFSLWHMLHMPIFFMLIIAGFVHVYAVHAY